jgi:hypothetical protein
LQGGRRLDGVRVQHGWRRLRARGESREADGWRRWKRVGMGWGVGRIL